MTSTFGPSSTSEEPSEVAELVASLYREEWGRLLSLLVTRSRRLDLAEDALAEAFGRAVQRWPTDGRPNNPAAWVYVTAWRLILGRTRAEAVAGRMAPLLATGHGWVAPVDEGGLDAVGDDRLQLLVLCCHPALSLDARSALALRLVMGTATEEIARLFLVPVPTMAARLTRAKKKIAAAGIPLPTNSHDDLLARLDEVCRTIYLAFTAGYAPGSGRDLVRADVAGDAVSLAFVVHRLVPNAAQVRALLALLLLQHSRRDARVRDGQLINLADQDRSRWHSSEIAVGLALVQALVPSDGYAEELRVQALIAAEHAQAPTPDTTNWAAIANLYADLESRTGSALVRLNRAVAVAEATNPCAGLALLDDLDEALGDHHRLHAVRAELARRAHDVDRARASYERAIRWCANDTERAYLCKRLAELASP